MSLSTSVLSIFLASILLSLGAPVALAQTPSKGQGGKSGWLVQCANTTGGGGLRCKAIQRIFLKKTRRFLLSVTVNTTSKKQKMAMLLHLPHGLYLPAGASYSIDQTTPKKLAIQTCDKKGCYAGTPLSDKVLVKMSKGQSMTVSFTDLNKREIKVIVSLVGFEAAFNKIK